MNKTTIALLAAVTASVAQAEFTVSGEIAHQGEGTLYLELLNEMQFANGENSALGLALEPSADKVTFTFVNVPAGSYVVQGFQDTNGNGELDEGMMGPKEPWAILGYTPSFSAPDFNKLKIGVSEDVSGLEVVMKK